MRRILFHIVLNMVAIAIVANFIPGLKYTDGLKTLIIISIVLAIANIFVKPIIKLLTLPIELVTLGLFGILINAGMLYLTASLIPQFSIKGFYFTGIDTSLIIIKPQQIPLWGTAVIASVLIGMITSTITWLTDNGK